MQDQFFYPVLFLSSLLFGCIIGAYYGTAEYRIRHNLKLSSTDCYCPDCRHTLPLFHQIPLLGYVYLKGKCHFCHSPIPIRYPLTEACFLSYYGLTFLLFHKTPGIYLTLWFLFVSLLLFCRCKRHYRSCLKGFVIMACYHALISLVYLILYAAQTTL